MNYKISHIDACAYPSEKGFCFAMQSNLRITGLYDRRKTNGWESFLTTPNNVNKVYHRFPQFYISYDLRKKVGVYGDLNTKINEFIVSWLEDTAKEKRKKKNIRVKTN